MLADMIRFKKVFDHIDTNVQHGNSLLQLYYMYLQASRKRAVASGALWKTNISI